MKIMSLTMLVLVAAQVCLWQTQAYTQTDQHTMKIGVINLKDCFDRYERVKDLEDDINNEAEKLSKAQKELEEQVQKAKEQYLGAPKGSDLQIEKYEQYRQKFSELKTKREIDKWMITDKTRKYRMEVYNDIMAAVRDVAKQGSYDIVLKAEAPWSEEEEERISVEASLLYKSVLYYDSKYDITEVVTTKLNEGYRKKKSATNPGPKEPEKK